MDIYKPSRLNRQFQQIDLAMGVHAHGIVAMRTADGAKPRPPQTMKPALSPDETNPCHLCIIWAIRG
jgi:hypothetical protein